MAVSTSIRSSTSLIWACKAVLSSQIWLLCSSTQWPYSISNAAIPAEFLVWANCRTRECKRIKNGQNTRSKKVTQKIKTLISYFAVAHLRIILQKLKMNYMMLIKGKLSDSIVNICTMTSVLVGEERSSCIVSRNQTLNRK